MLEMALKAGAIGITLEILTRHLTSHTILVGLVQIKRFLRSEAADLCIAWRMGKGQK